MAVTTYDRKDNGGNALAMRHSIPVRVKEERTDTLNLDLNGIPRALLVAAATPGLHGSQSGGFVVEGTRQQSFVVIAVDADGNTISGRGSPSYTVAIVGTGWSVQAASSPSPSNTFTIAPPGKEGSTATVNLAAKLPDATCSAADAVCNASFFVKNHLQTLFIGGTCSSGCTSEVLAYTAPYTGSPTIIAQNLGTITAMATDASGDVFVANCTTTCGDGSMPGSVIEYAPPYTNGPEHTITAAISSPRFVALGANNALFVSNDYTGGIAFGVCADAIDRFGPLASTVNLVFSEHFAEPLRMTQRLPRQAKSMQGFRTTLPEPWHPTRDSQWQSLWRLSRGRLRYG